MNRQDEQIAGARIPGQVSQERRIPGQVSQERRIPGQVSSGIQGWSRIGASADFSVQGFAIEPAVNPNPGTDLFVDVYGDVYDTLAGMPDSWSILLLAAVVGTNGMPLSLKTAEYETSSIHGYPTPYYNHIKIGYPGPLHWHAVLGTMPNNLVSIAVELFANHSDSAAWSWSLWDPTPLTTFGD
ncbi:MAG: hypothetical protein ACYDHZ_00665 [Dehalococcoidia bacterium]